MKNKKRLLSLLLAGIMAVSSSAVVAAEDEPVTEPTTEITTETESETESETNPETESQTESKTDSESQTDESSEKTLILGDISFDGNVNLMDSLVIQKIVLNRSEYTQDELLCGDVNKDGEIKLIDAIFIQKYALKMLEDTMGIGEVIPGENETEQETEETQPVTDETDPTTEQETEETQPVTDQTDPSTEQETEETQPVTDETDPSTEQETEETQPVTDETDPTTEQETEGTQPVVTEEKSLTLGVGEKYTITVDGAETAQWNSDNTEIATVSQNEITALSVGNAQISAQIDERIIIYKLAVKNAPTSMSLNKTTLTLGVGETFDLNSILPSGCGAYSVLYSSSNSKIAYVKAGGGLVTAKGVGTATVTATAYNGVTASCEITVKKAPTSISLNKTRILLDVGETFDLNSSLPSGCGAYSVLYSSQNPDIATVRSGGGLVTAKSDGITVVTVKTYNGKTADCYVVVGRQYHTIDFAHICQFPELPTGCEVTSLTAVLNYYGFEVSKTAMARRYLPTHSGVYYEGDFRYEFIGDPFTYSGFGCYAPCIVTTAENYFSDTGVADNWTAKNITGSSPDVLYDYVMNDTPVIVWVTTGWVTPSVNSQWYGRNGELITWLYPEHCLTLIGVDYNNSTVTVSDDASGTAVTVSMSTFESVFKGMGSQGVILEEK